MQNHSTVVNDPYQKSAFYRYLALFAGLLAWTFDGTVQNIYNIMGRSALKELLPSISEQVKMLETFSTQREESLLAGGTAANAQEMIAQLTSQVDSSIGWYFSLSIAMWLWGAAVGGVLFGWMGDRYGRARVLIAAIVTYSTFTALSALSTHWSVYLACRFWGALGLGGAWPLSVALMVETWEDKHRPVLAGLMGAGANVGYLLAAKYSGWMLQYDFSWREIIATSAFFGLLCIPLLLFVPEPVKWQLSKQDNRRSSIRDLFSPDFRKPTLIASLLSTIALLGTWGSFLWMPAYVDQIAEGTSDGRSAKAVISAWQSYGQIIGGFAGGMIAGWMGNKRSYLFLCVMAWVSITLLFGFNNTFNIYMLLSSAFAGLFVTAFFGWLPKYLPELFPTRIRATGQGFCYNIGRIAAGFGVLGTGWIVNQFGGDYRMGALVMCTVYLAGVVVIRYAPDTKGKMIAED